MPVEYVTLDDVKAAFTYRQVRDAFTDSGATDIDTEKFTSAVVRASAVADSILMRAYPDPTQRAALCTDPGIKGMIAVLVMHYGTERRPEFRSPSGDGIYMSAAKGARADLVLIADGARRPATEVTAGANPLVRGAIATGRERVFAPSRRNPKPRGY